MQDATQSLPWWRRLTKEALTEIAKEIGKYLLLVAAPAVVGVLGKVEDLPWFYVSVGVIVSGAGAMTWLVQFSEWRSRNRVEYKLMYHNMRIHLTQADDRVVAVTFGFNLRNTAAFPIQFKMADLKSKLTFQDGNAYYPPNKEYLNDIISIPPGGVGFFNDHAIVLPQHSGGNTTAELQCKVLYGKAHRFDHELELRKKTFIGFVGNGISGGQHWYDQ